MVSAAIHRENRTYTRALVTDKVAQGRATILHPYARCVNGVHACIRAKQVDDISGRESIFREIASLKLHLTFNNDCMILQLD